MDSRVAGSTSWSLSSRRLGAEKQNPNLLLLAPIRRSTSDMLPARRESGLTDGAALQVLDWRDAGPQAAYISTVDARSRGREIE